MREEVGTGLGCLGMLAVAALLVCVFVHDARQSNKRNEKNLGTPTLVVVTSDGLLDIQNASVGCTCEGVRLVSMIVNPNQIVSFEDVTTNKKFPKSSLIVLGSAYQAGKGGAASDKLTLQGVTKSDIMEQFTEGRKRQLIPEAK